MALLDKFYSLIRGRHTQEKIRKRVEFIAPKFDQEFYRTQLDGGDVPLNLIEHFLTTGWQNGLNPSRDFSTQRYLSENPDVAAARVNPLFHYLEWGHIEGRASFPVTAITYNAGEIDADSIAEDTRTILETEFDRDYYIISNKDVDFGSIDPVKHYHTIGWREGRDPSASFSTNYYLKMNNDIREGRIDPFLHYIKAGKREGRLPLPFSERIKSKLYYPKVSIVVPNYNHSKYLKQRLESIYRQSYKNIEVILLDDASTDNSVELLMDYASRFSDYTKTIFSAENSNDIFGQWRKGIEAATGDLIWICESDDFSELSFLENIVPMFADRSIMLAFGRVQFCDASGMLVEGLDKYRESAAAGIWTEERVRGAQEWFCKSFSISNIIPNVGGCVFRNNMLHNDIWDEASSYKIVGDWYLYLKIAGCGRIGYSPTAISYFRQHSSNSSVKSFKTKDYWREHARVLKEILSTWNVPAEIIEQHYQSLRKHFIYAGALSSVGQLSSLFPVDELHATVRVRRHLLIGMLGFHLGGGEIVPIQLANELKRIGYDVSVLVLDTHNENAQIRRMLLPGIPIYDAQIAQEMGFPEFLRDIGADLVHSHNLGVEELALSHSKSNLETPYVVTMHGLYECTDIPDSKLFKVLELVDHWFYFTDKNMNKFAKIPLDPSVMSVVTNGFVQPIGSGAVSRRDLLLDEESIVFTLASRAIPEKGWEIAIAAIQNARDATGLNLILMICGSGGLQSELSNTYSHCDYIRFLGFRDDVTEIYSISDVAILPTRFAGESFPLSLIQALQAGVPIISTNVGEISSLLFDSETAAGLIVEPDPNDAIFIGMVEQAVMTMLDANERRIFAENAKLRAQQFSIERVAQVYSSKFDELLGF